MSQGLLANQKPNVYEDSQVLSDETKGELGLPVTATPNDALSLIAKAICPIGSVFWLASQTIPTGFLLADGRAVSRTKYANLFKVIGTVFGSGDGSTTFNLPNLQAAFVRGAGSQDGYSATFGYKQEATIIYSLNQRNHATGSQNIFNSDKIGSNVNVNGITGRNEFETTEDTRSYTTRPYNIALTPIIKY